METHYLTRAQVEQIIQQLETINIPQGPFGAVIQTVAGVNNIIDTLQGMVQERELAQKEQADALKRKEQDEVRATLEAMEQEEEEEDAGN